MYETHVFDDVTIKKQIKIDCARCGKTLRRTIEDWQTINPYNVHKRGPNRGKPKTRTEIQKELQKSIKKVERDYRKAGVTCKRCSA